MAVHGEMFNETGITGDVDGAWLQVTPAGDLSSTSHLPVSLTISAGTVTALILEGRVSSEDAAVEIANVTASDGVVAARFPQMRVRVTGAAAATVRATIAARVRAVA